MNLIDAPGKLTLPFANSGTKNVIPVPSQVGVTPGAASLTDGFPPLTRTPLATGGVPPFGADMNGILFDATAINRWANAGGGYPFDAAFATDSNINGYPKGARIVRSDGVGYWLNTVDGNVTDPESGGAAAAGWVPDRTAGVTAFTMTNADVTLTPLQYGKPLLTINGTLTANVNLILPAIVGHWDVKNNTTGNFSLTVKTSAGTGVLIPQGYAGAVIGDGTNIYSRLADVSNATDFAKGVALVGGAGRVISSIATLRTLPKTGSPQAFVTGYYAPGDGGGGPYYYDPADTTSTDNGGSVIVAADGGRWKLVCTGSVSVKQFGAKGDFSVDDYPAIAAAIAFVGILGGTVHVPYGRYKTTSTIYLPSGVNFIGEGYLRPNNTSSWQGTSSICAVHTGAAVLSLKGSNGCIVEDIALEGDLTTHPKCGLVLGRSSAASAGFHRINRVGVFGYFSQAGVYSIASEDNTWHDVYAWLYGGGAKYTFYTSPKDLLSVDSMTQSTNLSNTLVRCSFLNSVIDANAACIYMEVGQSMGSWSFFGSYGIASSGAYIQLNVGAIDGALTPIGPFTFMGTSGERLSGGDPLYGVKLTATTPVSLPGLSVLGSRFDLLSGAGHFTISQDANLTLLTPNIVMQPAEAFPYATDAIIRSQVLGGLVSTGRGAQWAAATLSGTWTNMYGAPYAAAGYNIDSDGVVRVRGTVGGGTGAIFTLPAGFRPANNMFFPVYASGGMGRVLVTAATGVVSLAAGTATEVDLTSIQFNSI